MISKCKLLLTHLLSNARYTTLSMTSTSKYYSIWETKYFWSYNNRSRHLTYEQYTWFLWCYKKGFKTPTCCCAVEAFCCRSWEGLHWTFTEKENCELILLTDDTVEYLPVRRIENPVGLAGGEDERSCEPIMVEHLSADFQLFRKSP